MRVKNSGPAGALVAEKPEEKKPAPAVPPGGMGGMY